MSGVESRGECVERSSRGIFEEDKGKESGRGQRWKM